MERLKNVLNPRPGTDMQSELLDLVAPPMYLYTITSLYVHWYLLVLPYHYGHTDGRTDDTCTWSLFMHRCFVSLVYFEMMSNWLCARFVNNSCNPSKIKTHAATDQDNGSSGRPENSVFATLNTAKTDQPRPNEPRNRVVTKRPSFPQEAARTVPYWSWKRCEKCDITRPPRCHHCPLCKTCVLKRDHHCFFTGRCVGFYNHRHFVVFCSWASLGCSYASLQFIPYFYRVIWPTIHFLDIVAPFALVRWLCGYGNLFITNLMFSVTFLFFFVLLSTNFVLEHIGLICEGVTSFENNYVDRSKLRITDPRPLPEKIRAVLGPYWAVGFLVPLWHLWCPPQDDPYNWPFINVLKQKAK